MKRLFAPSRPRFFQRTLRDFVPGTASNLLQSGFLEIKMIYLAGPCFTRAEHQYNEKLAQSLKLYGTIWLPQKEVVIPEVDQAVAIRQQCINALKNASLVVAILDGADVDSGTAFECGYAYALGTDIYGLRTDIRRVSDSNSLDVNAMLSVCEHIFSTEKELFDAIDKLL